MSLAQTLLTAIVRADGDALVMHVGDKPYVVAMSGSIELSTRPLTAEAVRAMLGQLLPPEERQALDQVGAVEHDLPAPAGSAERFILVAARGGDDIWIEIRRYRRQAVEEPSDEAARPSEAVRAPGEVFSPTDASRGTAATWSVPPDVPAAVVLPMQPRDQTTSLSGSPRPTGLDRLLRTAAARGASTLYLVSGSRPLIRVEGDIMTLDDERALGGGEVEALMLEWSADPGPEALRQGLVTEWIRDVPEVGRVRCMTFRDHRGPGGIFRMIPARALSADQLGLSREIQGLCGQPDGFILVTGQRLSGKSTLISAFVDLINRTRSDHVITLESQIKFVHESRRSFVSQREVRGEPEEMLRAARAALREDPDVLVIEDLRSAEIITVALEAAVSGRLVIGAFSGPSATAALERILDQFPPDRRRQVQHGLAAALRGVIAQVLLRKTGGGRLAARELLLNTPAVANLIAEGKTFQLPLALDGGRKHGMVPLNDALAAFVQSGAIDAREAYRMASDREGLLNVFKRAGIDTSFAERLA